MKTVVFKYEIGRTETIEIPEDHKFLCVEMQGESIMMWLLVDPNSTKVNAKIDVLGTGIFLDEEPPPYLGTVFNGLFVWHIFGAIKK